MAPADRRKLLQEGWQLYRAQRFEEARAAFDKLAGQAAGARARRYLGLAKVAFQEQQVRGGGQAGPRRRAPAPAAAVEA